MGGIRMIGQKTKNAAKAADHKTKMKLSVGDRIFNMVNAVIMIIICLVIVYPIYYVVIASITDPVIVNSGRPLFYPVKLYLNGYKTTLSYTPLWTAYGNTISYTVVGTVVSLFATIPAGYALSRKDLPGRRGLIFLFTFTMFFSGGIIPLYLTIRNLGIYNSIWAMVLPVAVSAYNLIVCRSFFEAGVPDELWKRQRLTAARISPSSLKLPSRSLPPSSPSCAFSTPPRCGTSFSMR